MQFMEKDGALICRRLGETLRIEAWGENALRVRATMGEAFTGEAWALTEAPVNSPCTVSIREEGAEIICGSLRGEVNEAGVLSFYRGDDLLLREYYRNYDGTLSRESRCLKLTGREWKPVIGGSEYRLGEVFPGGRSITVPAPLEETPVFEKAD